MTMLAELIVSPAIQRERAKARRMGSLFLPEPRPTIKSEITVPIKMPEPPQPKIPVALVDDIRPPPERPVIPAEKPIRPERLTIDMIRRAVCAYFNITAIQLFAKRRHADIVRPRQICMYLCISLTDKSYPEVGRRCGGFDHTTVLHAARKIHVDRKSDSKLNAELIYFERELAAG